MQKRKELRKNRENSPKKQMEIVTKLPNVQEMKELNYIIKEFSKSSLPMNIYHLNISNIISLLFSVSEFLSLNDLNLVY